MAWRKLSSAAFSAGPPERTVEVEWVVHPDDAGACELKRKARAILTLAFAAILTTPALVAAAEDHPAAHEASWSALLWPIVNFTILGAALYYFLRTPFTTYLADRSAAIRSDLVQAAQLKASSTEQLAMLDQKLRALPGEIEALRARGAAEIASEEQRITAAAIADRDRLLEQARRDIDVQTRLAKRAILEHAADLSVQLATDRIRRDITPDDQERLVDRYISQVRGSSE